MRLKAIDLFAGGGGSSQGARSAGIEVVAAIDRWVPAQIVYSKNFPLAKFSCESCESVDPHALGREVGKVNLLMASPECTSHTCAKGRAEGSDDSRNTAFQVVRFAGALRPRWLVVENVVHMRRWSRYQEWLQALRSLGYNIREQTLNAVDFGVPQARRRLFVTGDSERLPPEVQPLKLRRIRTAREVIDGNGHFPFTPLKVPARAKATLERAERAMSEVGRRRAFLLVYYGTDGGGGWQRIGKPLRTVTTLDRFAYVRRRQGVHEMRMLQVSELKSAMGFPSNFRFEGSRRDQIKLLGNAVCPPVMRAIVASLISGHEAKIGKP
jgi:DNA (cytosine-5)-methyltransferase 1